MNSGNITSDSAALGGATLVDRWQRTAIAAFFLAEARGFAPGHELDDWLAAEQEIAAAVAGMAVPLVESETETQAAAVSDVSLPTTAPAKRVRRVARKSAAASPEQPKAVASKKTAVAKRRSVSTRKTPPGVESELGGSA